MDGNFSRFVGNGRFSLIKYVLLTPFSVRKNLNAKTSKIVEHVSWNIVISVFDDLFMLYLRYSSVNESGVT